MDFEKSELLQDPQRVRNFLRGRKEVLLEELNIIRRQKEGLSTAR
jgi:hypothetical protein